MAGVALLSTDAPAFTPDQARALAAEHYGVEGEARLLTSERDQNFRVTGRDGSEYVLKISNTAEDATVVDFQDAALDHIARMDPSLPVPRVIRARGGRSCVRVAGHIVRLMSWLSGELMHQAPRSRDLRRSLGETHARLGLALRDFDHPGADHDLPWDLKNAAGLANLVRHIENPAGRALAERGLGRFHAAEPVLASLRAQVIHNDLNPHNVVVCSGHPHRVTGVLDFGDMVRSPLICDVAVAASYHVRADGAPLADVSEYVAAYHDVSPLVEDELAILTDLIVTRLTMTVLITGWRAAQYPHNRDYILRNAPAAWAGLTALLDHDAQLEIGA